MNFLPLVSIPIIFLLVVLFKPHISKLLKWNICAVCVSVSSTWVVMLALLSANVIVDATPIAILMGMSVTGFMYKLEAYYKSHKLRHLWFSRLVVILGGFLSVIVLLQRNWQVFLLVGISSILLLVIATFLTQGTTHEDAVESAGDGVKKSLLKKLDNCC
ncbi:hypothetical protein HQ524_01730 [Candidatus Uhrbacteria bacterium]|nr:hypothetical protein [Candidatus Uhrbacteria bacterium]